MNKNKRKIKASQRGSSIVELIIVTVLFAVFIPISISIYISAKKISGQAYIQHSAAVTLGETNDILRYMRNQGFDLLVDGSFYLIRNPGTGSWLVKSDLPNFDIFERYITVSNALRHQSTDDIYFDGDSGPSYEDPDTKEIEIKVLWAPDYLPLEQITQTIYITNWQEPVIYNS